MRSCTCCNFLGSSCPAPDFTLAPPSVKVKSNEDQENQSPVDCVIIFCQYLENENAKSAKQSIVWKKKRRSEGLHKWPQGNFCSRKKGKKSADAIIISNREYSTISRNIGEDRTESEEKGTLKSESGLFVILGLVTSVARQKNIRPLFNTNILPISDPFGEWRGNGGKFMFFKR